MDYFLSNCWLNCLKNCTYRVQILSDFISDLISHVQVLMIQFYHFLSQTNLSKYNNMTVFLAPGVVCMRRCPCSICTELIKRQFEDCFKNRENGTVSFKTEYKETYKFYTSLLEKNLS